MKLCTDIKPRRTGVVLVAVDGVTYTFSGEPLAAVVDNEAHVAELLRNSNFYPEDEKDFERASLTLSAALSSNPNGNEDSEIDDDDDDGEELVNGGAPVEALTPAKPKPAAAKPKAKAK